MSHSQAHNRIRTKIERVMSTYDPIFNRFHNGNAEINNELKACMKAIHSLSGAFEAHDDETVDDDSKLSSYKNIKRAAVIGWALFIACVPTLLTFILMQPK